MTPAFMHLNETNGRVYTYTHITTPVPSGSLSFEEAQQPELKAVPANLSFEGDHHLIASGPGFSKKALWTVISKT
jgi:hypothetical protein